MANATAHARSALPAGHNYVVFNPGTLPDTQYFALADDVAAYEGTAGDFAVVQVPEADRAKASVLLYDFQGTAAQLASNVTAIVQAGIQGVFVTTTSGYM